MSFLAVSLRDRIPKEKIVELLQIYNMIEIKKYKLNWKEHVNMEQPG
jgi:hypothetical protein